MDENIIIVLNTVLKMFLEVLFLSLCFVGSSYGKTELEIREFFFDFGVECSKVHPVPMDEIHAMMKHEFRDHKDAKCLMACVFKKAEWIDKKGMFDSEKAMELCKHDDPEHTQKENNAKNLFDVCKKVNDESVSDGDNGCDRAYLLANCLTENSRKFGFET